MRIVKVIGGLGNQMFQYALYLSLKDKFQNERILIDKRLFNSYKLHNGFEIDRVFHLDSVEYATQDEIKLVTFNVWNYKMQRIARRILPRLETEFIEENEFFYDNNVFNKGDLYYEGYWQNYNYFKEIGSLIRNSFQFKNDLSLVNSNLLNEISNEVQSVSIHVRRGDYLNHKTFGGICNLNYYLNAIEYVKNIFHNPIFYFFSNDFTWCRDVLLPLIGDSKYFFIDWNTKQDSYIDMQLMSYCKFNIIANSSFSWWGAWLNANPNKIVIAPKLWWQLFKTDDVVPDDWVRL